MPVQGIRKLERAVNGSVRVHRQGNNTDERLGKRPLPGSRQGRIAVHNMSPRGHLQDRLFPVPKGLCSLGTKRSARPRTAWRAPEGKALSDVQPQGSLDQYGDSLALPEPCHCPIILIRSEASRPDVWIIQVVCKNVLECRD